MKPLDSSQTPANQVKPECFELLARNTEDSVIVTDAERRIVWTNDSFTRICGYTFEEVRGRKPSILQGKRTDHETVKRMHKAFGEGRRVKEKILNYTKLGHEYWADLEIIPARDDNGVITNFLAIARCVIGYANTIDSGQLLTAQQASIKQASIDGLVILDRKGKIVDVNPAYCSLTGYSLKELLGVNISAIEMDANKSLIASHISLAVDVGKGSFETLLRCKDGSSLDVQVSIQYDNTEKNYVLFFKDISERKIALQRIARLTTLYRAINECNEAILYSKSRIELFQDICRIVVCLGNMKMAWVGKPDPSSGLIQPLAIYGAGKEYLENIVISTSPEIPEGRGPAGTALREKQPIWCDDFANNPMMVPWHERAARYGWKSAASIPFSLVGRHDEVLTFYGDHQLGFGDDVRELLVRMVKNISFALDKFDS